MSKQRPSDHLTSGLFNVLADVCASGTYRYRAQADLAQIHYVIAPVQDLSFRGFQILEESKAHILQTHSFDQQSAPFENH